MTFRAPLFCSWFFVTCLLICATGASLSVGVPGSLLGASACEVPPAPYSRSSKREHAPYCEDVFLTPHRSVRALLTHTALPTIIHRIYLMSFFRLYMLTLTLGLGKGYFLRNRLNLSQLKDFL